MRMSMFVLAAALVTGAGLLVPAVWMFTICGTALFLVYLWRHTRSLKSAFLYSSIYSTVVSASGVAWFWDAFPLSWLHLSNSWVAAGLLFLSWISASVMMSIGPALLGLLLWKARSNSYRIPLAGLVFVLADEARMWGFALLTYSPTTPVGPHFSVSSLGYVLSESPFLLQLSSFSGVQTLTFFAAIIAACIAVVIVHTSSRIEMGLVCAAVFCVSVLPVVSMLRVPDHHSREPLSVVLVSTQNPIGSPAPTQPTTKELLHGALKKYPDVVVFPEGHSASEAVASLTYPIADSKEVIVVSTTRTPARSGGYTIDLVYDSTIHGRLAQHSKEFLMALGEYSPSVAEPLFAIFQSEPITKYLASISAVRSSDQSMTAVPFKSHKLGGLLCSESISPYLYSQLSSDGATILINSANPSWFPKSHVLHNKLQQIGRVHAVANRAYYLHASNILPSFAISPLGSVVAETDWNQTELLVVLIP